MRLDVDLLTRTRSSLNPLKDRELDLRGHKISVIENLGVTKDQLDAIDFSDNSISSLSNFPLLKRLQSLNLSSNPVKLISPTTAISLPNLRNLILINSEFGPENLGEVGTVLGGFKKLDMVTFRGTKLAEANYYREWIVWNCKKLRSLDFERIKDKDRAAAKALFQTAEGTPTDLANSLTSSNPSKQLAGRTFEPGHAATENGGGKVTRLLNKEEKERVRRAIEGATSVEEIRRLTRMLAQGFLPTEKDLKDLEKGN